MDPSIVLTIADAARLTGLSESDVRRLQRRRLFRPAYARPISFGGVNQHVYSFRDIVELATLMQLKRDDNVTPAELRRVAAMLRQSRRMPLAQLRLCLVDGQVVTRMLEPDTPEPPSSSDARIEWIDLDQLAERLFAEARWLRLRPSHEIGKIVQRHDVMGNQPIVAGTRIPTSIVREFHEEGYAPERIIQEYPDLTLDDVAAALAFESDTRRSAA